MVDPITSAPAWRALTSHRESMATRHLRDLFAADPDRGPRLAVEVGDLYVDYSKQRVDDTTLVLLRDLAEQRSVPERFSAMFTGAHVNVTEDRAALHHALRLSTTARLEVDGVDVVAEVHDVLRRMRSFADGVRDGSWRLSTGETVGHVVNIGIGGSDLGPAMASRALRRWVRDDIHLHFVANVDGDELGAVLRAVDPARTLFVVASKTFTTLETMTNATHARGWLQSRLGSATRLDRHFVAVSTNAPAVTDFGIDPANMFGFWDWVGGRFSVGSAIGLSLMIGIGPDAFDEFLGGFRVVDDHAADAPIHANAPVLLALLGLWNRNFLGASSLAVLPYSDALGRFPAYLQQLEMESNGKRVDLDGAEVPVETCPVVWGEPGTNGQHAFYQLLHQGTSVVPVDLIGFANPTDATMSSGPHHRLLSANLLAQAEALAFGRSATEVEDAGVPARLVPHRTFPGNVPSTTILAPRLTPAVLGQLIALYEHKVAAQGFLWGVNSFDQWGVELGKQLATTIAEELAEGTEGDHDSSTVELMRRLSRLRTDPAGPGSHAAPG